jgi:hypothetical protein
MVIRGWEIEGFSGWLKGGWVDGKEGDGNQGQGDVLLDDALGREEDMVC